MTIRNRQTQCFAQDLTLEWTFSLIFIFCGCVCLTSTLGLTIAAQWDRSVERYSRWAGFLAGMNNISANILRSLEQFVRTVNPNWHEL